MVDALIGKGSVCKAEALPTLSWPVMACAENTYARFKPFRAKLGLEGMLRRSLSGAREKLLLAGHGCCLEIHSTRDLEAGNRLQEAEVGAF